MIRWARPLFYWAVTFSCASAGAGNLDPESQRTGEGQKERAQREWNKELERRQRDNPERPAPPERAPVREVPKAPSGEVKTTYLRDRDGGITVVQSNAGGSTVSRLAPSGQRQPPITSSSPRHAEYVDAAQRQGGHVVDKAEAERRIREIAGRETERQAREREEERRRRQAEFEEARSQRGSMRSD